MKRPTFRERWMATARNRLRVELAGLAFATRHGHTPEEYAGEVWGRGAGGWMGKPDPTPLEYLHKEAAALANFYPWVKASARRAAPGRAEFLLSEGCLAGWGEDRWAIATSLGLSRQDVCRYCSEAFRVWGEQMDLKVSITPLSDGTCLLSAAGEE